MPPPKPSTFPWTAAVFGAAFLWFLLLYRLFFKGAGTFEFAHYAEIGRNLAQGHGCRSRVLYPASVAILQARGLASAAYPPLLDRFPLPAYLSALGQLLLGPGDFAPLAGTGVLFAFWIALVFHYGRRWFGARSGLLACSLFALVPAGAKYFVLSNLPDVGFGALVFWFHALLSEEPAGISGRRAAALGALAGAAWLFRPNFWLWLPIYLAYMAWKAPQAAEALRSCAVFSGSFLLVSSPALLYNLRWFSGVMTPGAVWNLAHHVVGERQPWLDFRTYSAADIVAGRAGALLNKAWGSLHSLLLEAPGLWQLQALVPFSAAGALALRKDEPRRFMALNAAALAVQAPVFCFLRFDSWGLGVGYRYLFWICPALILLAVRGAFLLFHGLAPAARGTALALWLLLHLSLIGPFYTHDLSVLHVQHPSGLPPRDWPEMEFFRRHARAEENVVSNLPAHVAWYAGTGALALPNDPEDVPRLDAVRPLKYLFLSAASIGTLGDFPLWTAMLSPDERGLAAYCAKHGYQVAARFPAGVIIDLRPPRS